MKPCRFLHIAAVALAFSCALNGVGQAIPAAHRSAGEIRIGIAYSNGNSDEVSKRIGGLSVYGTYNFLPHFAFEGDVHLLQFLTPQDFGERSYLGGGRLFYRIRRYEPYVKFLGGVGQTLAQQPYVVARGTPDSFGVFSGGGGLDIQGPHHVVIRAIDFEKQTWPAFPTHDLAPSVLSFGLAYQIK